MITRDKDRDNERQAALMCIIGRLERTSELYKRVYDILEEIYTLGSKNVTEELWNFYYKSCEPLLGFDPDTFSPFV